LFIAVGDAATAFHSPDGKTWTRANINGSTNLTTLAIGDFKDANNADHWVAIAGGAEKKESIFRSDNGTDWKVATANNSFPGVVALTQINNGQFYALANPADDMVTYSSSDGQAWLAQGSFIDKDGSLDVGEAGTQRAIAVTPDGLHAYTGSFNNSLLWYNVNRETGALTYQGQIPISHKSLDLVVTPDGKYLYSARGSSIYCYTINSDGSLIDERVTAVPNVSGLTNVTVHPNGKYLYSASNDRNKDYIVWHEIDPNDGSLTLGGSITRTSKGLNSFVIAPSGDRAYGIDYENRIRTYQVASNGALAPFFQENYFVADNQLNTKLTLSPDGKYLVAFNALNAYQFKVNPSSLTSDFSSSPFDKRPMNAAFAPSGGYLYFVQEDSSQIRWFSVVQ
jgi:6-phosphogluconolactonase (cycloisomerase 2 family)